MSTRQETTLLNAHFSTSTNLDSEQLMPDEASDKARCKTVATFLLTLCKDDAFTRVAVAETGNGYEAWRQNVKELEPPSDQRRYPLAMDISTGKPFTREITTRCVRLTFCSGKK